MSDTVEKEELSQPVTEVKPVEQKPVSEPVTVAKRESTVDYDAELAAKDLAIKKLQDDWLAMKNDHHLTKEEVQKARTSLAEAVSAREKVVAEKDRQLKETSEELATVSQATQTLSERNGELQGELESQAAKATKFEVLTEEFPGLLMYSKLIPASRDPEAVRAACKNLQEARTQDLEAQRIAGITGNPVTGMSSQPIRVEPQVQNRDDIKGYLDQAGTDPKEYERRRQMLIDQYEATKQRQLGAR